MKKLIQIKFTVLVFILTLFALDATPAHALWWMGYHKPVFRGRVLDAETKEPIEGAVVVVQYTKETMMIPEHNTSTIEVRETLTDAKGNFEIPSYTTIIGPFSHESLADFIIYKPGYGKYPGGSIIPKSGYIYSKVPAGTETFGSIAAKMSAEDFFSDEVGKEREFWGYYYWYNPEEGRKVTKVNLPMGVVELPRLKTKDERIKAFVGVVKGNKRDLPLLYKLISEEEKFFKTLDLK